MLTTLTLQSGLTRQYSPSMCADAATLQLGLPPVALSWVQLPYFQKFQLGSNGTHPALKVSWHACTAM